MAFNKKNFISWSCRLMTPRIWNILLSHRILRKHACLSWHYAFQLYRTVRDRQQYWRTRLTEALLLFFSLQGPPHLLLFDSPVFSLVHSTIFTNNTADTYIHLQETYAFKKMTRKKNSAKLSFSWNRLDLNTLPNLSNDSKDDVELSPKEQTYSAFRLESTCQRYQKRP